MTWDVVAIDGPSGAGKTTVARAVARRLGYRCLETGALYRTLTLLAMEAGVAADDAAGLKDLAAALPEELDLVADGASTRVLFRERDITERLRRPEVEAQVSQVAAHEPVRAALLSLQRRLASEGRMVMEGRDIGTVVVPGARHKYFLTASLAERVRRRHQQLAEKGIVRAPEQVRQEMERRDARDASRRAAPLKAAADAVIVDTTGQSVEQVVEAIVTQIQGRAREGGA